MVLSLLNLPLDKYPDTKKQSTMDTVYLRAASTIVETKIEIIENQISGIEGNKSISSVVEMEDPKLQLNLFMKNINEAANDVETCF